MNNIKEDIELKIEETINNQPEYGGRDAISQAILNNNISHEVYENYIDDLLTKNCELTSEIIDINNKICYYDEKINSQSDLLSTIMFSVVGCGAILISILLINIKSIFDRKNYIEEVD